jgi:hypothetical protein
VNQFLNWLQNYWGKPGYASQAAATTMNVALSTIQVFEAFASTLIASVFAANLQEDQTAVLLALANRWNAAVSGLRHLGNGYYSYITGVHLIGPFGGDYAVEITRQLRTGFVATEGTVAERKQLVDFTTELEGVEEMWTGLPVYWAAREAAGGSHLEIVPLPFQNVAVAIY